MRFRLVFGLLVAALSLSACARHAPRVAEAPAPVARSNLDVMMYGAPAPVSEATRRAEVVVPVAATIENQPYTLDSGDKLRVVVFGQEALSNTYLVDADGRIALPLIGAVAARGLTTPQLSSAIATRLARGFIRDPSVAVEIDTYRPFFVLGEVTFPGQYPYVPGMTAESAVAIAGGFTPRAFKDTVEVSRKVRGANVRADLPLRAPVRPGDTITVSERWF